MGPKKLTRLSGRTLLTLFLIIAITVLTLLIGLVLNLEAKKSIQALQETSSRTEIQAAKNFMEQFFIATDMHIAHLSEEPALRSAVLDENKNQQLTHDHHDHTQHEPSLPEVAKRNDDVFKHLHQFHLSDVQVKFCLFNTSGTVLFSSLPSDGPLESRLNLLDKINTNATQGTVYALKEMNAQKVIQFYKPIYSQDEVAGVIVGAFPYESDSFFTALHDGNSRWFSLTQPGSSWFESPPDGNWTIEAINLSRSNISLMYGINQASTLEQQHSLLMSLGIASFTALAIATFIIYLFGQKLLISPYSRLEKSQKQLAKQTQKLEEKQQEARLLADVVRHARDAIVITNNQGLIEWVNPAFVSMTGFSMQDVKGKRPGDILVNSGSDPAMVTKLHQAIDINKATRVELLTYDKDSNEYWLDIDLSPTFSDKGDVDHFILVQRDMTDYKKLQRSLELAVEDADTANIAKSRFLATMSHEIRTPMNGVLGMIQVMLSETKDQEQRENLSLILESGNHLISILNDILDLTKVEQNKIEFESAPFSIEQIISPLDSTYAPICREKGISLEINNQLPTDGYFLGDKKRVRQILYNLINNAIKFTHKGKISVSIYSCLQKKNNVTFTVSDTGIGIDPDNLKKIFDPFVQADASTTRKFGGTGLGLAIVKQLIEKMGGELVVNSQEDKGTQFEFSIPLEAIKESIATNSLSEPQPQEELKLNVLVVEDNEVNCIVAQKMLEKEGHQVHICHDGSQAIDLLTKNRYDLILMDNHMPGMDGIEASKIIRKKLQLNTVLFGWTADVFAESKRAFFDAGADQVLNKPLQKQELLEAISSFSEKFIESPNRQ